MELVIRAGDEVGCPVIEELTLAAPLVLPAAVWCGFRWLWVGPMGRGCVRCRCIPMPSSGFGVAVACRGQPGVGAVEAGVELSVWPPVGAVAVELGECMRGWPRGVMSMGRAFQGLRAVWRRGEELFAEVSAPRMPGWTSAGLGCIRWCWMRCCMRRWWPTGKAAGLRFRFVAAGVVACGGGVGGAGADRPGRGWGVVGGVG